MGINSIYLLKNTTDELNCEEHCKVDNNVMPENNVGSWRPYSVIGYMLRVEWEGCHAGDHSARLRFNTCKHKTTAYLEGEVSQDNFQLCSWRQKTLPFIQSWIISSHVYGDQRSQFKPKHDLISTLAKCFCVQTKAELINKVENLT